MGRRSPVLGYNHNVRYRGLVFHVQTEDSGIVNPHLFTHLFHGGVIVSTRKLVYDPDADDGVVKSLMQAQHKAVMKELRRGVFDDKIDINLRGTPGLLPRGVDGGDANEDTNVGVVPTPASSAAEQRALDSIVDPGSQPVIHIVPEGETGELMMTADSEPSSPEITVTHHPNMTPPGIPVLQMPSADQTVRTAPPNMDARARPVDSVPPLPPAPRGGAETDPPPAISAREAAAIAQARAPTPGTSPIRRATTPPPVASASLPPIPPNMRPQTTVRGAPPVPKQQAMSAPQVVTRPLTRDPPGPPSDVSQAFEAMKTPPPDLDDIAEVHSPAPSSAAVPPGVAASASASEYIHRRGSGERPIRDEFRSSRMPQLNPQPGRPPVPEPRPVTVQPPRRGGSQAIETQRPGTAPPTRPATAPVPVQADRTGSRPHQAAPVEARTRSPQDPPRPPSTPTQPRTSTPGSGPVPTRAPTPGSQPHQQPQAQPQAGQPQPAGSASTRGTPPENAIPVPRTRTPTAPRPFSAPSSTPRQGTPAPAARARSGSDRSGGGVVMSRPAVIVGARSQPPTPNPQHGTPPPTPPGQAPDQPRTQTGGTRVRRAREEGGRGVFGQDLISEKSLDEVILAYLSEDANEE